MQKFIFTLLFLSNIAFAIDKTFIREYTYKASDYDSKITSRRYALEQVTEQLLREVGVYIKSETQWDKKEINYEIEEIYEKKIDVITAGIAKIEVIDEKWTGIEYWVKAKVKLNPKDVLKQIDALVNNKEKFDHYEKIEKDNNKANKEIERLRKELAIVKSEKEQLELSKSYNKQIDKLSAQDWFNKAYDAYEDGDIEKAISFSITSIELDPEYVDAYNNLGVLYGIQDEYDKAETNYLKAIELDPEDAVPYYNLGNLYDIQDEYDKAETNYLKAIELDPEYVDAYNNLGYIYDNQDEYDKAEANYLKAIELDPEYVLAYYNLGILYYIQDEYDKAETNYLKAIELDPEYVDAYINIADIYYSQRKYNLVESSYLKAIELDPRSERAFSKLASLYHDQGKYKQSESNYLKAIELEPKFALNYNFLGLMYFDQGRYDEAESNYLKAIELDPKDAYVYYDLGSLYNERDNDTKKRLKYYKKAAQLGNKSAQDWLKDNGYTW